MKRIFTLLIVLLVLSVSLMGFSSDYNAIGAQQNSDGTGISDGMRQGTDGAGLQMGRDTGVYEFKPAEAQPAAKTNLRAAQQAQGKGETQQIVVTARQIPETIGTVARDVSVIDSETINNSGILTLSDLLHGTAGFFIKRTGGLQGLQTLYFRGSSSRETLVMIDGVPLSKDNLAGGTDLSLVELSGVERVEIVKGGMSSMYGADAVAGAVNLITGSKEEKIFGGSALFGTFNTQKYSVSSAYRIFNVDYAVSASQEQSDGYRINSDYLKRNVQGKVSFAKDFHESIVSGYYNKRDMGVPGGEAWPSPNDRQVDETYGISVQENLDLDMALLTIKGFTSGADLFYHDESFLMTDSRHIKKETRGTALFTYNEGDFLSAVIGYEFDLKTVDSSDVGKKEITNNGAFTSVTTLFFNNSLVVNVGAREDVNSVYGNMDSENISAKYIMPEDLEVHASFERSYTEPTLGHLYWPEYMDWMGNVNKPNENLKPERTMSYEAGLSKKGSDISESVSIYKREITDMINREQTGPAERMYVNVGRVNVIGLEASVDVSLFGFIDVSAAYTYNETVNGETGEKINNMPQSRVSGSVSADLPYKTRLIVSGEYSDYREDFGTVLPAYYLVDAKVKHELSKNVSLFVNVSNILDNRTYELSSGYPMQGRTIMAGLDVKF